MDIISVDEAKMKKFADDLTKEAEIIKRILQELQAQVQVLKGGGWVAEAANSYYRYMEDRILPGTQSLHAALGSASDAAHELQTVFSQGDEQAAGCFPSGSV